MSGLVRRSATLGAAFATPSGKAAGRGRFRTCFRRPCGGHHNARGNIGSLRRGSLGDKGGGGSGNGGASAAAAVASNSMGAATTPSSPLPGSSGARLRPGRKSGDAAASRASKSGTRLEAVTGAGAACASSASDESSPPNAQSWEEFTQWLVDAASVPFIFLLVPQVIKNCKNLLAGNPQALACLSAEGYFVSFLGNVMLMSYFVSKRERGAVIIQGLGVASNFAMLTQIFLAGFLPAPMFNGLLAVTVGCFAINIAKVMGVMDSERMVAVWDTWQSTLGVLGLAVLPQVLWQTFTSSSNVVPGCAALAAGLLLNAAARLTSLPPALLRFKTALGACTATLLFMLQPIAQLALNFSNPSSLEGLSLITCCLAMVGNAMMVPRALYTQDLIWFAGCSWGYMLMGWGQLLSLFIGTTLNGSRFLGPVPFAAATVVAFGYFAFVVMQNTRSLGLKSPLGSFSRLQWPQQEQNPNINPKQASD